ncbi:hypothetical protein HFO69_12535 [Rhizobium laguerreae]|uniref:hypothetical protein n=1 Tax=Rhizobium laguerreae TaxID=1076926 RepID=UPI001C90A32A|nr:hypothetical protein [Rhizobium laguerreae]MBY3098528.1 hypothetical protein [Rhizobium laguerreae]
MLTPILQFTFFNVSNSSAAFLTNDGAQLILPRSQEVNDYDHDNYLKDVPPTETCTSYQFDDDGRSPVFSVDANEVSHRTVAYVPKYEAISPQPPATAAQFPGVKYSAFTALHDADVINATFYFKILNSGTIYRWLGWDRLAIECSLKITQELLDHAKNAGFGDVESTCRM